MHYIINVGDPVPCIVLHIIQNKSNTLHAFYFQYINTSSEPTREDSSYELRTHINLISTEGFALLAPLVDY